jgi:hypothetical protein
MRYGAKQLWKILDLMTPREEIHDYAVKTIYFHIPVGYYAKEGNG